MHDIAIRNGRVIDGTGTPEFHGDIAVDGTRITAVGDDVGKARREIDAEGKLVVPAGSTSTPTSMPRCRGIRTSRRRAGTG